jgi:hypothetical protein
MTTETTTKFDYDTTYVITVIHNTVILDTVEVSPDWCASDKAHWDKLTYYKQFDLLQKSALEIFKDYLSISIER